MKLILRMNVFGKLYTKTGVKASPVLIRLQQQRYNRSTTPLKPSVSQIAQIRKRLEQVSIVKARQALIATDLDIEKALLWLKEDAVKSGAQKSIKLATRTVSHGLIGLSVGESTHTPSNPNMGENNKTNPPSPFLAKKGVLVEVLCETDFVSRNQVFQQLTQSITTSLFNHMHRFSWSQPNQEEEKRIISLETNEIFDLPITSISSNDNEINRGISIKDKIAETVGKVGENIQIKRILLADISNLNTHSNNNEDDASWCVFGSTHGGLSSNNSGTSACLAIAKVEMKRDMQAQTSTSSNLQLMQKQLSQQIIGSMAEYIDRQDIPTNGKPETNEELINSSVLLNQPFIFNNDLTVRNWLLSFRQSGFHQIHLQEFVRLKISENPVCHAITRNKHCNENHCADTDHILTSATSQN